MASDSEAFWTCARKYSAAGMIDRAIKQRMIDTIPLATPVTVWNVLGGTGTWRTTSVSPIIASQRAITVLEVACAY